MRRYSIQNIKNSRFTRLNSYLGFHYDLLLRYGVYIAGGSLRTIIRAVDDGVTNDIHDIDVFFPTKNFDETFNNVVMELYVQGYECIFKCEGGELFTFKKEFRKVQLITGITYDSLEHCIKSFDFHACAAGIAENQLILSDHFIKNVRNLVLSLQTCEYPVATLKRLQKYLTYGYTPDEKFYEALVEAINSIRLTSENMRLYVD